MGRKGDQRGPRRPQAGDRLRLAFVDDFVPALVVSDEVVDIRAAVVGLDGSSPQRLPATS